MRELTDRQREVLDFIAKFSAVRGYAPTVRDVAGHFGISPHGAYCHIRAIGKKGYLSRDDGRARTMRVDKPR